MTDVTSGRYTIKQVALRLDLSKDRILAAIRRGDLHAIRDGSRITFEAAEAEGFIRFIESQRETAPDPNRPRGSYCASAPHGRCICRCHLVREGMQRPGAKKPKDAWLPKQDEAIKVLVVVPMTPDRIAVELTAMFHVPRTGEAVRQRMVKLGISARDGWVSGEDLIRKLGLHRGRLREYEAAGILQGASWHSWRRYSLASVEQLIRQQAGRSIDPRRIKHPAWKSLAEVSAVANARRG